MRIPGGQSFYNCLNASTATSRGTTLICGANNTKGAWTSVVDGAGIPKGQYAGMLVTFNWNDIGTKYYVDLALGDGSSANHIIAPNLMISRQFAQSHQQTYLLPIEFSHDGTSSVDIYARAQNSQASYTIDIGIILLSAYEFGSFAKMRDYGADLGTTHALNVDPGSTANTKASWYELTSGVDFDTEALSIMIGTAFDIARTGTPINVCMDIGIGSAGSEQVIIPNLLYGVSTTHDIQPSQIVVPVPCSIPAGTRLAARAQSNLTTADNLVSVVAYGFGG